MVSLSAILDICHPFVSTFFFCPSVLCHNLSMQLQSLGGAGTVTGSMHWLSCGLLIDCGLFQGEHEERNHEPFPFSAADINAVILTHAHLDHVGRLPLLVKRGYRRKIYATPATAALAELVMMDAARLHTEQYTTALRESVRLGTEPPLPPLYDETDVRDTLDLLSPTLQENEPTTIAGVRVTPFRAGHILGSVYLLLEHEGLRLLMSGDLGRRGMGGVSLGFALPPEVDVLVLETTYAGRVHPSREEARAALAQALQEGVRRGGKILMPTFALERAQGLLHLLGELMEEGKVPRVPIFLDSPMARAATRVYTEAIDQLPPDLVMAFTAGKNPFAPPALYLPNGTEANRLGKYEGAAIILAGNGMMTGGRMMTHLREFLPKKTTSLVVTSYQSPHTLGGVLVSGAEAVTIAREEVPVRAHVTALGGFSAHADTGDLELFAEITRAKRLWMVHGEQEGMAVFATNMQKHGVQARAMPSHEWVTL